MRVLSLFLIAMTFVVAGVGFYRALFPPPRTVPPMARSVVSTNVAADTDKIKQDAVAIEHEPSQPALGLPTEVKPDEPVSEPVSANPQ